MDPDQLTSDSAYLDLFGFQEDFFPYSAEQGLTQSQSEPSAKGLP